MPDSVTVLVVPGLAACLPACAELEACLPEWVPLGPSFPVLEQVVLGTLFSGRQEAGLELWAYGRSPSGTTGAERPVWLWEHLARHRPQLPSACWLLPLPGQTATLGAHLAGGKEAFAQAIWPPAVRAQVHKCCGPWPGPHATVESADQLEAVLEALLRWCFASAAAAFRCAEPGLGIVYVPVVLAGAYLWGAHSPQGTVLAQRCAAEVLEFLTHVQVGTNTRDANTVLVVDPWGMQQVEQAIDLEPVRRRLDELARRIASAQRGASPQFVLQVEHQVAQVVWSSTFPLTAEQLRKELVPLAPQVEIATAEQCGLVPAGGSPHPGTTAELWLLAPEGTLLTCSQGGVPSGEEIPGVRLACWELPVWLKRWGIECHPAAGFRLPRATHGLAPQREHQRGRLWASEPGLLFGQVLSDLDLAALVLSHWGI